MIRSGALRATVRPGRGLPQFRIWHLWFLAEFVAVAIVNIQDQRRSEPALIALASAGFVLYAVLGWAVWNLARRFRSRMGTIPLLATYFVAMAGLFLLATIVYLLIEYAYLVGF